MKTNGKKKETTLDDLALMIGEGFANTPTKLDHDILSAKVDRIDERLRHVETKVDRALYTELTHLEARMRRVEKKVGITSS